jgi:hypothetical protein
MHLYHGAKNQLPAGSRSNPRQTWVMFLWGYIEQGPLEKGNNLKQHFYLPPATLDGGNSLRGLTGQYVPLYYCPSDLGSDQTSGSYQRRRGTMPLGELNTADSRAGGKRRSSHRR